MVSFDLEVKTPDSPVNIFDLFVLDMAVIYAGVALLAGFLLFRFFLRRDQEPND